MADPKLNALVFCKKAVFTEPWINLIGVFDEVMARRGDVEEFDAFIRLGDVPPNRDCQTRVQIVDPETGAILEERQALSRGDSDGVAHRTLEFRIGFPREGVYEAHIWYDQVLVDVQKFPVVLF